MRVYEFAKELKKDSGDLLEELNGNFGFKIKSHLSSISEEQMKVVRLAYEPRKTLKDQVENSHTRDLEEKFNTGVEISADEKRVNVAVDNQIAKAYKPKEKEKDLTVDERLSLGHFYPKGTDPQKQEIIVEKPGWFAKLFSWLTGN